MTQWFVDSESDYVDMSITVRPIANFLQALRRQNEPSVNPDPQASPKKESGVIKDKDFKLVSDFQGEEEDFEAPEADKEEIINLDMDATKSGVYQMTTTK